MTKRGMYSVYVILAGDKPAEERRVVADSFEEALDQGRKFNLPIYQITNTHMSVWTP